MRTLLALFLSLTFCLFASGGSTPQELALLQGQRASLVEGCVSAITGDFIYRQNDLTIKGAEPITIPRQEVSSAIRNPALSWKLLRHSQALVSVILDTACAYVPEPNGVVLYYTQQTADPLDRGTVLTPWSASFSKGIINEPGCCPQENRLEYLEDELRVHLPNGGYRLYKYLSTTSSEELPVANAALHYILEEEALPNGNKRMYSWEHQEHFSSLIKITTTNPSGTKIYAEAEIHPIINEKGKNKGNEVVSGPHTVTYRTTHMKHGGNKIAVLKSVVPVNFPEETLERNKKCLPVKRSFPSGRELELEYDDADRVIRIRHPHGLKTKLKYYDTYTKVTHPDKSKTYYHFTPETLRLSKIEHPDKHVESFEWTKDGYLSKKALLDPDKKEVLSTSYLYDKKHNLIEKTLRGKISSKDASEETYSTYYTYDPLHRLLEEREDSGKTTTYTYLNQTTLPSSILVTRGERVLKRTCYEYNEDNLLIQETTDDGDTYTKRLIKRITPRSAPPYLGLPETIEELYEDQTGEHLLKKVHYSYDKWGNIHEETHYDAQNTLRYRITKTYNKKGQLLRETDPLGHTSTYAYDENGNCILEESPRGRKTSYEYDLCNRKLSQTDHHYTTHFDYETDTQPMRITTPLSATFTYQYDPLGNLTEETDPYGSTTQYLYDPLGNATHRTDPRGHTTETSYNIYNKPLEITYPDGTRETYTYNLDGTLHTHTDPNGIETSYSYDDFGNVCQEILTSEETTYTRTQTYSAFRLEEETNLAGYKTTYKYDGAGRCIEKNYENSRTTYIYDPLGRLIEEQFGDLRTVTSYDLLNREIKKEEYTNTTLLTLTEKSYDANGNLKTQTTYPSSQRATTSYTYDLLNRETSKTLPDGTTYTTTYTLEPHQSIQTTHEPEDITTIEITDANGQLLTTEKHNLDGLIEKTTYTYDPCGNCTQELTNVLKDRELSHTYTIASDYDSLNRPRSKTICDTQLTTYTYTPKGELASLTKPDGTTLTYTYDLLGNQTSLTSSDGSIEYEYSYDPLGNLLASTTTKRTVDAHGNILSETLDTGYTLTHTYDPQNRRTSTTLPTKKTIAYTYLGPYLHTVCYKNKTHTYTYDLAGNPLQETHIDGSQTHYTYDPNNRPCTLESPHCSQTIQYSPRGNALSITTNNTCATYSYDAHDHLIQEPEHTYAYDSIHNRIQKNATHYNLNPLNQLTTSTYDANGNPLTYQDHTYTYDALDRLIRVTTPTESTTYTYDTEHRRLKKNQTPYLWDGNLELGTLATLRILGYAPLAEIGATIAIETNRELSPAYHNLQGDLIHHTTTQTFTAFGEGEALLPWGYSSKRHDPETGLIYFGRRYYDPALGRFLTPDPAGYTDSANLYAFALNNPLTSHDPNGLTIASSTMNLMLDDDFRQMGLGVAHGALQCAINTSLNLAKYGGGIHGPEDMSFANLYTSATTTDTAWRSDSHQWLQTQLHADPSNPFYSYGFKGSYIASEFALSYLAPIPFAAAKGTTLATRAFTTFPKARTTLKTMGLSKKIFQSNKSIPISSLQTRELKYSLPSSATSEQLLKLLSSAQSSYKGSSRVGHAISKHAGRHPQIWGSLKGPSASWNENGMNHLRDIYYSNVKFEMVRYPGKQLTFIEKRLPDGRGIRLNKDYTFKGFID